MSLEGDLGLTFSSWEQPPWPGADYRGAHGAFF